MNRLLLGLFAALLSLTLAPSAFSEPKGKEKTAIFKDSCSGPRVSTKNNLAGVCKEHDGEILVKCRYTCLKKKGLKCKEHGWKKLKAMSCEDGGKTKLKMVKCSASEQTALKDAHTLAQAEIRRLEADIKASIPGLSGKTKKRMEHALAKVGKIKKALDGKIRVACKDDDAKRCEKGDSAYTFRLVGQGFKTCPEYFTGTTRSRAHIMIHELAHKGIANWGHPKDSGSNTPPDPEKAWHTDAYTYHYWLKNGFCVPGSTCPAR